MRIPKTPARPAKSFQVVLPGELIELYLDTGVQQPQLYEQFPRHGGRFGKSEYGRK